MINIVKQIALVSLVVLILTLLGAVIDAIIPWSWLTYFFTIIRNGVGIIDFMWDTDTMFTLIALSLSIVISVWAFKAGLLAISYFKHNK